MLLSEIQNKVGRVEMEKALFSSVVGLGCRTLDINTGNKGGYGHISGFLLSIGETWFFVTAGHCLSLVDQCRREGKVFVDWHIDDVVNLTGGQEALWLGLEWKDENVFYIDRADTEGDDYGAIRLESYHRTLLEMNKKTAFDKANWIDTYLELGKEYPDSVPEFLATCIIGLPNDLLTETEGTPQYRKHFLVLQVEDAPNNYERPSQRNHRHSLYGKIADEISDAEQNIHVRDLRGISGGPIINLHIGTSGKLEATLCAIQSMYYPKDHIIIGCRLLPLIEHLRKHFSLHEN